MAKTAGMPEGHLHAVVDAIAAAGSQQLARRAAEGAPVPFDLVEVPSSGGAPLFSYRPRTRDFVEEHIDGLRQLAAWPAAVNVLAGFDGLGDYLLTHGERHVPIDARERADLVLRVLLATMHADSGDFLHTPARSAEAAGSLSRCLLAGRVQGTVVVPLLGVRLEGERLELEDGLVLMRDDVIADLPREARSPVRSRPGTVVVVSSLEDPARAAALAQARPRLRALLTALRLYDTPAPALAPVAWSRMRGDGWASNPFIGTCARASGTLEIPVEHESAVRGFCALMAARAPGDATAAWALRRFELACERGDHGEALTDVLLGLRALLETDQVGSGAMADRLAALCAAPGDWDAMRDRVQIAEALEIALMQGRSVDPSRTRALSLELRGHLRALLRDMACGHLPADLVEVAEHHLSQEEPLVASTDPTPANAGFADHEVIVTDTRGLTGPIDVLDEALAAEDLGQETEAHVSFTVAPDDTASLPQGVAVLAPAPVAEQALAPAPAAPAEPAPVRVPEARPEYIAPAPAPAPLPVPLPAREAPVAAQASAPDAPDLQVHDPRSVTEAGESFEEAFIRSLTEGPEAADQARRESKRALRRVSRRGGLPRR